jgi:hypothetical protein
VPNAAKRATVGGGLDRLVAEAARRTTDPALRTWLRSLAAGRPVASSTPAADDPKDLPLAGRSLDTATRGLCGLPGRRRTTNLDGEHPHGSHL